MTSRMEGLRDGARQVTAQPIAGHALLVDDMHEDAELLATLLTPLEANVIVARSVDEALSILNAQVVDLVVTDLEMPGGSGLDLARELQTRYQPPAVIFMTGSGRPADRVAAFELGAVAYLPKPVDVQRLIRLAREILRARCPVPTNKQASGTQLRRLTRADKTEGGKS